MKLFGIIALILAFWLLSGITKNIDKRNHGSTTNSVRQAPSSALA